MIQVIELRLEPEVMIIMPYYPSGNLVQAKVYDEDRLVSAFGQILDCLSYLHKRNIAHRDLKPENILVQLAPYFKVVVSDFGMAKMVTPDAWLETFCGSLKYAAPEVFPSSQTRHGPPVDVWSLGVMGLEWLHGVPASPSQPRPKPAEKHVSSRDWLSWVQRWVDLLMGRLEDQEPGQAIDILHRMLVVDHRKRWTAAKCLMTGFENGLFKRRAADGLVVCMANTEEPGQEAPTPLANEEAVSLARQDTNEVEAIIVLRRSGFHGEESV